MATSHSSRLRAHSPYGLHNGDFMMRREFHSLYEQMPEGYRAELIGGVVFEPSPLSWSHSKWDIRLSHLFETYSMSTPGVEVGGNATVMLSEDDELQPDLIVRLGADYGGSRASMPITMSKGHQSWWQRLLIPVAQLICI